MIDRLVDIVRNPSMPEAQSKRTHRGKQAGHFAPVALMQRKEGSSKMDALASRL